MFATPHILLPLCFFQLAGNLLRQTVTDFYSGHWSAGLVILNTIMNITNTHWERLESMKKQLTAIGYRESTFVTVELLFYEALDLARTYGDDWNTNTLLATLKKMHEKEYARTKELFRKPAQRERVIRQFMAVFKSALSSIKKPSALRQVAAEKTIL